jgi:hypothetical protein
MHNTLELEFKKPCSQRHDFERPNMKQYTLGEPMSASRFGFQPLEPSRMHDFWLVTWFSVVGFGVFLGFVGQTNDWLRLLLFTVGTALGQFNARKFPSISILGFLLFTLVIYGWMYLDPTSAMQRLQVGTSMFAFFATSSVFTLGVYYGDAGSAFRLHSILEPSVARLDADAANR